MKGVILFKQILAIAFVVTMTVGVAMGDDITQLRQDIEELKKAVFELQQKLSLVPELPKPLSEPKEEIAGNISDLQKRIRESLNGKTLILTFNLKGFCMKNNSIFTHETGFAGIGFFGNETIFFVPSEKVVENRKCPEETIEKFFSIFSNKQRIALMRAMIGSENITSTELQAKTGLTEGQFYHHIRELASAECVIKKGQDQYRLSDTGKILLLIAEAVTSEMVQPAIPKTELIKQNPDRAD